MKGYLTTLGVVIIVIGVVGGSLNLSSSYDEYQRRLQVMRAAPGAPVMMFDEAKWGVARALSAGVIFGGVIWGSVLMALGWMVKTMEQVRDALSGKGVGETREPRSRAPSSSSPGQR